MNILLTGATGLIGKKLGIELAKRGHAIYGLSRNSKEAVLNAPFPADWIECDLSKEAPNLSHIPLDGVIHLAGENVGEKAWSTEQKNRIRESRVAGTKNLLRSLSSHKDLKFFLGASAIGYYGNTRKDETATEDSKAGQDFLAQITEDWEKTNLLTPLATRTLLFRIGVVLSTEGGALPRMMFPAQVFASSTLGSGNQWMSWIHIDDVVNAFLFAMENPDLSGVYNLVAPFPIRQKELANVIGRQLNSLSGPAVPKFVIKSLVGEQASLALASIRVSADKLQKTNFRFQFETIGDALEDLLSDWRDGGTVKVFRQYFPFPRQRVFEFFSKADNLEKITPDILHFTVLKISTPKLQKGTLLDYKLKIRGVPVTWRSHIDHWVPDHEFTDSQVKGPYSYWIHNHRFEDLGAGTLMTDVVRYKVPAGLLGRLVTQAWVDKDVENIFRFRREAVGPSL